MRAPRVGPRPRRGSNREERLWNSIRRILRSSRSGRGELDSWGIYLVEVPPYMEHLPAPSVLGSLCLP